MPATVVVNFRTVVHASSNGMATFFPDVCKTPVPPSPSPIPIPYPNIAQSSDTAQGSTTVKCDGKGVIRHVHLGFRSKDAAELKTKIQELLSDS